MRRTVLFAFLLLGISWAAKHNTWRRAGYVRFVRSDAVVAVSSLRLLACGAACTHVDSCISFNYHSGELQCELLNAVPPSLTSSELVAESGWSFYILNIPTSDPCYNSSCPITTMCLRYDQPLNHLSYDPSLYKHTCSDNVYFLLHRKAGRTDCLLGLRYGMDLYGYNTAYIKASGPYYETLAKCLQYSCAAMVCFTATNCYLKYSPPDLQPQAFKARSECDTWSPVCQEV